MANKVQLLDSLTINKIAAGEVVENAASVVKELIENSLDAKAKKIIVEIVGGGRELISIADDGSGMTLEDALLCVERHATSKITKIDDLFCLQSFGFRGEALSSISAISDFRLFTKYEDHSDSSYVFSEGGKIKSHGKALNEKGTKIEVRSLFYNVPVRRKFQKSKSSDEGLIVKTVSTIALCHPDVHFELYIDGRKELFFQVHKDDTRKKRIGDVLGNEILTKLKFVSYSHEDWNIEGYLGIPELSKSNRTGQYLFVNMRPITSLAISYGVKDGYGTTIDSTRHPLFILFLQGPVDQIDVNVHPQKKEIRFFKEDDLKKACTIATSEALFSIPQQYKEPPSLQVPSYNFSLSYTYAQKDFSPKQEFQEQSLFFDEKPFKILATVWQYIFIEATITGFSENTFLVDAKKAHECIFFEKLSQKDAIESQHLLVPKCIDLTLSEFDRIQSKLSELSLSGFIIREFAKNTLLIEGVPIGFDETEIENFFSDLLKEESFSEYKNKLSKKISLKLPICHDTASLLIERLLALSNPFFDPRGAKILAPFIPNDLAKFFTI